MQVIKGFEAGKEALDRGSLRVWDSASPQVLDRIEKLFNERLTPREVVSRILDSVRWRGDSAVLGYTSMLDGVDVDVESLEVPKAALKQAYDAIPADLRKAMETAAARVRSFQQACMPKSWIDEATGLGEQFTPMARAGVYAPGGLAAYPSTVLMTAIPAKVAGVDEDGADTGAAVSIRREVATRAEGASGTSDDEHSDVRIAIEIAGEALQLGVHRIVDGVEALGAVERGDGDAVGPSIDEDRVVVFLVEHCASPRSAVAGSLELGGASWPTGGHGSRHVGCAVG